MKIGVISDTHGHLSSNVFTLFEGVDRILHAGDIGKIDILYDLQVIAPVEAVYGNTDSWDVRDATRESLILHFNGLKIALCHGAGDYHNIHERLKKRFEESGVRLVVHGHTHKPTAEEYEGVFMFNPGDGRKTVGIIDIDETGGFSTTIIEIE